MKFTCIDPNYHYSYLRLTDTNRKWELGMSPFNYGMRMRMGTYSHPPKVIDFCMGLDSKVYMPILQSILRRLESATESASPACIDALFPWKGRRPRLNDDLSILLSESLT